MTVQDLCEQVQPLNREAVERSCCRWDAVAKPLGSLGELEKLVTRICGICGTDDPDLSRKAVLVFCADNGVVAEGVSQSPQAVTATVARSLARGTSSVCAMAKVAGADVLPVDVGMAERVNEQGLLDRCVRRGTDNLAEGLAMTRAEAERAILIGAELVRTLKEQGYGLLAVGEMGIGNTTTSAAVVAALLGLPPEQVTGRGAGLSDDGLVRKQYAIRRGLEMNHPDPEDPLEVLSSVGGLDIAAMLGVYLGGAVYRVSVVMDGYISAAAALCAVRLCPSLKDYLLPSHQSAEPAAALVMRALGLHPVLRAGLRLGEGTGAVALMPLLDMALAVYRSAGTFDDIGMEAYQKLS